MKINLDSKLKSYSSLAMGVLAAGSAAGQIQYKDINPDKIMNVNDTFYIDMDSNGINDFQFFNVVYGNTSTCSFVVIAKGVNPLSSNEVLAVTSNFGSSSSMYVPRKLNLNDTISGNQNVWTTYSTSMLGGMPLYATVSNGINNEKIGKWRRASNKFLGVRFTFEDDTNWRYAWVRMDVLDDSTFIIKDYAWEYTPNKYILAGLTKSGIEENIPGIQAYIYRKELVIRSTNQFESASLMLYNAQGQIAFKTELMKENSEFDLCYLPIGLYIVKIQTKKGILTKKVMLK